MQQDILPQVIFSPGQLALELAHGLSALDVDVTLFTPGPVPVTAKNITADLSRFEHELKLRGDNYLDLLKKHPLVFISLARQVQSELIARAYDMANRDELDVIHIYTNEEEMALPFSRFCHKPVVFTHHDPFNFSVKYRHSFSAYAHVPWISLSMAQRRGMPADTNWVANIPHGLDESRWQPTLQPTGHYLAYLGRIIEPKGLHLAIAAVRLYNASHPHPYILRIAGKHYAGGKDQYWQKFIAGEIDGREIIYDGYIPSSDQKAAFLGGASALVMPSTYEEPFGMVMIEALACGTPVIGLRIGAIPEIVIDRETGTLVDVSWKSDTVTSQGHHLLMVDPDATAAALAQAIDHIHAIDRNICRQAFERRFTSKRMCADYRDVYLKLMATESLNPS